QDTRARLLFPVHWATFNLAFHRWNEPADRVLAAARAAGVTTVAVAGRSTLDPSALEAAGIARAYVLSDLEPDPERSMREAAPLLRALASRIAADWLGA
ncbi:MAG TPA: glycerate kinase, partial [Actinomycetes bacterium]|nr:glycerate kinase [Actinomycetes bacterium]